MHPVEAYLRHLYQIYTSGARVYDPALANLLNEIGQTLKPRVRCLLNLKSISPGLPDGGLFTLDQFPGSPESTRLELPNNPPARGVIMTQNLGDDLQKVVHSEPLVKYLEKYRQVLVTNYRAFVLAGFDAQGQPAALESYLLAETEADFWAQAANPHHNDRLLDYLKRVMLRLAPLATPEAVTWLLASYAREAHGRLNEATVLIGSPQTLPLRQGLDNIRVALEATLGLTFEGEKGAYFLRALLVQTLFYAMFSAWVLWHYENPARQDRFQWPLSHRHLHTPLIQAFFRELAQPIPVGAQRLDLAEVLAWSEEALNRVDQVQFFSRFRVEHAIRDFYEPFLRLFSPQLSKMLGVWYTPPEVAQYIVTRVDTALREELGLPDGLAESAYLSWPRLSDIFALAFPGVKIGRDPDLVDFTRPELEERIRQYFEPDLSDEAVREIAPTLMITTAQYDPVATRSQLLQRGIESGYFVKYAYRPFDSRHVYWHPETKLLAEKREDLFATYQAGNAFLICRKKAERGREGTPFYVTALLADRYLTRPGSICFPITLRGYTLRQHSLYEQLPDQVPTNLSAMAHDYLLDLGIDKPDTNPEIANLVGQHILAIGYSPEYLTENMGALRMDWPRIPMPASEQALRKSATLGQKIAVLLNPDIPVPGVTTGLIRPELKIIGVMTRVDGAPPNPTTDLGVTVGWGHVGRGELVMPGQGQLVEREYNSEERAAIEKGAAAVGLTLDQLDQYFGRTTYDVYLNEVAYWTNIPLRVWEYTIGGYQIIKKWLSYREQNVLGRPLQREEAQEVMQIARRLTAIVLLEATLDANYRGIKQTAYEFLNLSLPRP